jgi:amino acid adenylation domain-containing protein
VSSQPQNIATYSLSPQQELLLLRPDEVATTQAAIVVADSVSEPELRSALEELISRHEILRTTFARVPGMRMPQQVIHDSPGLAWSTSTLRLQNVDGDSELDSLLRAEARALDPERGPILRAALAATPTADRLLVVTTAAACLDAQSMRLLLGELGRLCRGAEVLADPLQYADYAEWRRQLLEQGSSEAEAAATWWGDSERPLSPLLFGRQGRGTVSPARLRFREDAPYAAAVESLQTTDALFLEATVHALVARLSGERELVLAGLIDGRANEELTEALGPYAQLVPIRSRIDRDTTFAELVDQLRRARGPAARWQDLASSQHLAFSSGGVGFSFHVSGVADDLYPARSLERLSTRGGPLALEFAAYAGDGDLSLEVAYDPSCYREDDARRFAAHLSSVVASAAGDPFQSVARLALLTKAEQTQVGALADGGEAPLPALPVHQAFAQRAAAVPRTLAVTDGAASLTYGDLDAAANRLAHRLRALGVRRGQAVALCFDRSVGAIVGLFGIMKAAAAFVPLNFEHPPGRLAHQLDEAEVVALVTQERLLGHLPRFSGPMICLDRDEQELAAESSSHVDSETELDDVAYVMYTSGSTGLPKGVVVTHRSLANYTARMLDRLEAHDAAFRFAIVSALSTDLGYTSVFPPLVSGGSVHLIPPQTAVDPDAFAAFTAAEPIDVLKITPSLLSALLAEGGDGILPRRWLISGGEALTPELVELIRTSRARCRIMNHYGPTEATIGTCTQEVPESSEWPSATVPIGRPLENTRAYVVDEAGGLVPPGVAGELWIGGTGVALGYVRRADETAERFAPDPFSDAPNARVYKTGDRCRYLPDGSIEFLGRIDQQIKIRGFRVEPGEIEATLLRHPAVRQVAVVPHGPADDLRLFAYVVASPRPSEQELRSFLGEWLPAYMVPSIVESDALPLTPSGKVDRSALPDPAGRDPTRDRAHISPRTDLEREIAELWQDLLGVSDVGVTDDFFALGGHSLLATQMIMRIRRRHGDIPLRVLFTAPTIAALAEAVEATETSPAGP